MKMKLRFLPLLALLSCSFCFGNVSNKADLTVNSRQIAHKYVNDAQGFIDYWVDVFRPAHTSICDTSKEDYDEMMEKYEALSINDQTIVNNTADSLEPQYTIGHMIKQLVNKYYPNKNSANKNKNKLDQSTTIIIAVVVSIFGMSAISVLYILKRDDVIK